MITIYSPNPKTYAKKYQRDAALKEQRAFEVSQLQHAILSDLRQLSVYTGQDKAKEFVKEQFVDLAW